MVSCSVVQILSPLHVVCDVTPTMNRITLSRRGGGFKELELFAALDVWEEFS